MTLEPTSPFVGQLIQTNFPIEREGKAELVAVFRHGHTLLPKSNSRLRPGDRALLIVSRQMRDQ